jgi:hypothetical protein
MRARAILFAAMALAAVGCEDPKKKQIEQIDKDSEILRGVGQAVSEVVRNQEDCTVAKPLLPEAYQRIEDARSKVTGPASPITLDSMKAQVDRVAQACP